MPVEPTKYDEDVSMGTESQEEEMGGGIGFLRRGMGQKAVFRQ